MSSEDRVGLFDKLDFGVWLQSEPLPDWFRYHDPASTVDLLLHTLNNTIHFLMAVLRNTN